MNRYTIAHALPWSALGGTEHATLRIAQNVDPDRFRSIAFCLPEAGVVRELFADAGFQVADFQPATPSYRRAGQYLRNSWRLARELKRHRVDLLHCADLLAGHHATLGGRLAGVPVLCHIRNRFDQLAVPERRGLGFIDKFAFVSHDTWRRFGYPVPPSRGVVIYDGIDAPSLADTAADGSGVRREFNIPEHAPIIGMTARVAPQKDYATLAGAAARVLRLEPSVRFMIVGDVAGQNEVHYQEVRQLLEHLGLTQSFVFTGYRSDVRRILAAMDIFVLSTHCEGLPLAILEAMAQAKPVVATAVDGIPEVIEDGRTGLLFGHQDDVQLAEHFLNLLQDRALMRRLGEAGRGVIQSRFSTRQFAENMNGLYAGLLASRRQR